MIVAVGCYTRKEDHVDGKGTGVRTFRLAGDGTTLLPLDELASVNPTYLVSGKAANGQTILFVTNEIAKCEATCTAMTVAASGKLSLLNRSASPPPDDAERTNEARIVQSHSHVVIRTSESFLVRGGIAVIATELPRSLLYWTGRWLSGDSRAAKNVSVGANELALARCCA